jgi:hypothetical protein
MNRDINLNTLVYIPTGLPSPELEILLSKAQEIINLKKKLNIIICSGEKNYACSFNPYSQRIICLACKNRLANGLKNLKGNYNLLETPKNIKEILFFNEALYNKIRNKKKLLEIFYKNIDIGIGAYSSYLNLTRDLNLEGRYSFKSLKKILKCSVILSDFFLQYLNTNKIDEIFIFNGRMSQNRPLFRIAKMLNIKVNVLEHTTTFKKFYGVRNFKDNLPFDYTFFSEKIKNFSSKFSLRTQKKLLDQYFQSKQNGVVVNDKKSFVNNQIKNLLPEQWDFKKKNIVFFTSADDEYEVLGEQYKSLIYKNQTEAITRIAKGFYGLSNNEYHLWIRIHPNMKKVHWSYSLNILKLNKLNPNVHVINARSKVSSYELIRQCDKFLTFYSSSAIEAVYMNKPSILLSKTYFDKLNCFYIPVSHTGALKLIFNQIRPKKKEIKNFVNFWVETGEKQKFFSGNFFTDYKFNNVSIKFSFLISPLYYFGKFLTYYFYNFRNYRFKNLINIIKI